MISQQRLGTILTAIAMVAALTGMAMVSEWPSLGIRVLITIVYFGAFFTLLMFTVLDLFTLAKKITGTSSDKISMDNLLAMLARVAILTALSLPFISLFCRVHLKP